MVGKPLSALLQILRSSGVTEYHTIERQGDSLTLETHLKLGPVPPKRGKGAAINVSPEALAADQQAAEEDEDDKEPADWRFALERTSARHFPKKVDPRKAKQ